MKEKLPKVLIITYYWPPAGGSGVQRWVKFVKYFREFGWEPVIYTASNPEVPVKDESLLTDLPDELEVIKTEVFEPYDLYRKLLGKKKNEPISLVMNVNEKPSFFKRLAFYIRSNFFIPDAKMFWIKPSVKILHQRIKNGDISAIISSGPPHSCHLIALELKKRFPQKPWLADFRDPWTNIDFFSDLNLSSFALNTHKKLEREVLQKADAVLAIGKEMIRQFQEIQANTYHYISNGFDQEELNAEELILDSKFTIAHIGLYGKTRNHPIFFQALKELIVESPSFAKDVQLIFVGQVDDSAKKDVKRLQLNDWVLYKDFVPHDQVRSLQASARVLYLSINDVPSAKGILTGKIFEYLQTGRPLLLIGPKDGDAADILNEVAHGDAIAFNEKTALKKQILSYYQAYQEGTDQSKQLNLEQFTRKHLTKKLSSILNEIVQKKESNSSTNN